VWIDFPPELDRGAAIMTFEVGSATYTFALPASADTLRLPDELAPDDEVRVEAILFDRSLRQLGLDEGPLPNLLGEDTGGPLPRWRAAYGIDVKEGQASGDGRGWRSLESVDADFSAIRLPFACPERGSGTGAVLEPGVAVRGGVVADGWSFYEVATTAADAHLTIELVPESGDADLFVRRGTPPNQCKFDCRPERLGAEVEWCEVADPGAATWSIGVRGVETAEFSLRAEVRGSWVSCGWVGVEDAGINSHQRDPRWCPEGTFLTQIDQLANRAFGATDAPLIGAAQCCGSGDVAALAYGQCTWREVAQAGIDSLDPAQPWCPDGAFLIQVDLDGGLTGATGPVIGAAHCCTLQGAAATRYGKCDWHDVDDSHVPGPAWCPEGAFLTQLDLDACAEGHLCPIIARARCCRPAQ